MFFYGQFFFIQELYFNTNTIIGGAKAAAQNRTKTTAKSTRQAKAKGTAQVNEEEIIHDVNNNNDEQENDLGSKS